MLVTLTRLGLVFAVLVAEPADGGGVGIRLCHDLHTVADHECGIKAETEVPDDPVFGAVGFVFVLLDEVHRTRERNVADVFGQLLLGHTDSVVGYAQRAGVLVKDHVDGILLACRFPDAKRLQPPELGNGIGGVGHDLTEKDVLFGIEPFFDDREDVLGVNRDPAFFELCFVVFHRKYTTFLFAPQGEFYPLL